MDYFKQQTGFSEEHLKDIGVRLISQSHKSARESDHHRYHVGSAILSLDKSGDERDIKTNANRIPAFLKSKGFDSHQKIGDGSTTVHGEFPLLYHVPPSKHIFLGCNTPTCAACLKSAVMRGVDAIFLDASSLPGMKNPQDQENPWTQDRAYFWNTLILPIAEAAQIPVYAVNMEQERLSLVNNGLPPVQRPKAGTHARILQEKELKDLAHNPSLYLSKARGVRAAIGVARHKKMDTHHFIYAEDCHPPGFTQEYGDEMQKRFKDEHYRFPLDPIIHMCMEASKHNLELMDGRILSNYVPSSGRQLDLAHIGLSHIFLTDGHLPASSDAQKAMEQLSEIGAIDYTVMKPDDVLKRLLKDEKIKTD
ncbi:MAG: hypothetical protein OEY94_01250 [Alphaproteobacteria bacterium]|nr:hypothetical protein [Alphaproteobacteria bacterium]